MNQTQWISIISLLGWLVLAVGAYRSRQLGAKKTVVLALTWLAIFFLVAALFTAIGH